MRVFTDMNSLPVFRNPVVTVGSFDGVHRGHKSLLEIMREKSCVSKGETIVVTFAEHPRNVLKSGEALQLLTSLNEKILLLEKEGIDNLVVMPFDDAVSRLSPEDFIRDFIIGKLGAKELVVGYNHHFGHNKNGSAATLQGMEAKYGFHIYEAPKLSYGEMKISSTTIRKAISEGNMRQAGKMMGHPYTIMATVGEEGELMTGEPLKLLPPHGRYFVDVNGVNGIFTVGGNGSVTLETAVAPVPGTELLISF